MITNFWKLIKDEQYQNEVQRPLFEGFQVTHPDLLKRRVPKVADLSRLGSAEYPIAVNGVFGEISYLSLLRTSRGSPFAFHRVGSGSGTDSRLDVYELLSLDLSVRTRFHLDLYYSARTRQAPKGFKLANEFLRSNPIFGTHNNVPDFPIGISHAVRELSKDVYGCPAPVNVLRQFEGLLSEGG